MLSTDWPQMPKITAVPDIFITTWMKEAPGDYVKLYLYLLLNAQKGQPDGNFSIESLGHAVSLSANDVRSGLTYWEKNRLLDIYYQNGDVSGIRLRLNPQETIRETHRLSPARVQAFTKENADAKRLLFVAEQYYGRPLTAIEISTLLYFMDELHFSFDLCDQLIQYCVGKGHTSIRYLEKVGLAWHKNGYTTPEEAKAATSNWSKIHFAVLKAFGIKNRNPIQKEVEYIDRWSKTFGFSEDVIAEACAITLHKTGEQRFDYADAILSRWHAEGLHSLADIKKQNADYKAKQKKQPAEKSKNQFLNFQQRDNDLDELEKKLDRQFADLPG